MGVWLVSADALATSRFVTSPLIETVNALGVLASRNPQPWERDWLARHGRAFRDRIKTDPFSTVMAHSVQSGSWLPVDLSVPPRPDDVTFEQELARVRAVPPQLAKFDLTQGARRPLPDALDVPDPAGAFADLLQWTWDHTVRADWPRRKRKYEADIISRTTVLSQRGWAVAIDGLTPEARWLGGGQLQITVQDHRPVDLGHGELLFIPSSLRDWRVAWEWPVRFAFIYPAAGMLATPAAPTAPEPLRRLLGPTRAEILLLIGKPVTTTQLAALTGLALGTIGDHLRILSDAGLAERHRSGAHVLYRRTPTGQQLLGQLAPAGPASHHATPKLELTQSSGKWSGRSPNRSRTCASTQCGGIRSSWPRSPGTSPPGLSRARETTTAHAARPSRPGLQAAFPRQGRGPAGGVPCRIRAGQAVAAARSYAPLPVKQADQASNCR